MTETVTLVNTDLKYVKTELFDPDRMDAILCDTSTFSKRSLGNLGRYKRGRKYGNKVSVMYEYGKGYEKSELGRLFAKGYQGLQSFPTDIRNPLTERFYWDVDMENCHYNILASLADSWGLKTESIQKYIQNRDAELTKVSTDRKIAKTAFLKVAYGGNIKLHNEHYSEIEPTGDLSLIRCIEAEMLAIVDMCWTKFSQHQKLVQKAKNPKFSLFALILQTEERKCLLAMDEYAKSQNRSMDVLIFDGGLIRKLPDEKECPTQLLRGMEDAVFNTTGYRIKVVNKPIEHNFQLPEEKILDSSIVIDDAYAAEVFASLLNDSIVLDCGVVWVFDNSTGIWSSTESHIQRVITLCKSKLVFKQSSTLGVKVYNYSGCVKNTKNLIIKLPSVLPKQDGFMKSKLMSDVGKLLFTNGIYDFKSNTFTEGFDNTIVFRHSMPRPFPTRVQSVVDKIRDISFTKAFSNDGAREVMLHTLMRALIGDSARRKYVVGLGYTASGKSLLAQLCLTAFGDFCSTFNGNSLLTRFEGGESEKELSWVLDIASTRFAFSSEIKVPSDPKKGGLIDGNLIKSIVSGSDELKVRKLYQNSSTVVNKSTIFIFANDMPRINPVDDAIRDRTQAVSWGYSYVDEPKRIYERKRDPILGELYRTAEYGDAFFWLLVEEYAKWQALDFAEPVTPECVLEGRDDLMPVVSIEDVILENYEITKSKDDFVSNSDLLDWLRSSGVTGSDNKIGRDLTNLGLLCAVKKIDRKSVRGRTGLRRV